MSYFDPTARAQAIMREVGYSVPPAVALLYIAIHPLNAAQLSRGRCRTCR